MRALGPLLLSLVVGCSYDFDEYLPTGGSDTATSPPDGVASDSIAAADDGTAVSDTTATDASTCTGESARTFEGHCYFALTGSATFDSAQSACASTGAHLATITSAAEEAFVEGIRPGRDRWIGLRRPDSAPSTASSFAWITGETSSFAKWGAGEPNGSGTCARLRSTNEWADQSCSTREEAICERD